MKFNTTASVSHAWSRANAFVQGNALTTLALLVGLGWLTALVLQYGFGMMPCSLCILQRWALTGVGVSCGLGALLPHRYPVARFTPALASAAAGLVVSLKHVWLQLVPVDTDVGCGFGGEMLLEHLPFTRALPKLFAGSGDCAGLPYVLHVPLPAWVALLFSTCIAVAFAGVTQHQKSR